MAGLTEIRGFQGELLGPEDAGYDQARRLWNAAIDKRPALIARCCATTPTRPSTPNYVDSARIVAVEFVNMMAAVDRLVEAARVLAYLDTTEGFGVLARDTLVADAVASAESAQRPSRS